MGCFGDAGGLIGTAVGAIGGGLIGGPSGAVAGAQIGGSLLGSSSASDAQTDAAKIAAQSTNTASDTIWKMYQQTRADLLPSMKSGNKARSQVENMLAKGFQYKESPMYQFEVKQGQNALAKAYNAQGALGSGAYPRANAAYVTGLAGKDYYDQANLWLNTQINPRLSLADSGQVATQTAGSFGANAADQVGANTMSGANALASGRVASQNAWTQGAQGVGNALSNVDWSSISNPFSSSTTTTKIPTDGWTWT